MADKLSPRWDDRPAVATGQSGVSLIAYLPFGIVRGHLAVTDPAEATNLLSRGQGIIEIRHAFVEHYSNHLPTGKYASLLLNLQQVAGFSIVRAA